ncbi:hypothetical protein ACQP2U_20510 [Nocardia sp. CA-084685]|uniref:hypothetical protein n=1 Tax=Nocardia sp. CA-084685 TaxID=3239970 RepID=UPI003D9573E5
MTSAPGVFVIADKKSPRLPDRPVPPMRGTAAVGEVVYLLATAIEEGRDLSSMSGIPADSSYRLLPT